MHASTHYQLRHANGMTTSYAGSDVKHRKYNVLTMCNLNLVDMRTHHDSIMSILIKYIKRHTDYTVYADEKCQYTDSMLRVDLQIEDSKGNIIFLIDIE